MKLYFSLLAQATPFFEEESPKVADLPSYGSAIVHMLLVLFAVIGLLLLSLWFVRRVLQQRLHKGSPNQVIHILEKRMLSPKTMLYWVEAEGKGVLLAESQVNVQRLETFSIPLEPDAPSEENS